MSRRADEALRLRLRELLARRPGRDDRLAQLLARGLQFRDSAVLLPLVIPPPPADPTPELLYIVRHSGLPTHSGQIAFPGGKREPSDSSLEHTALRESHEEIGLGAEQVELCGLLDDVPTTAGFSITPVVGLVRGPLALNLSPSEVAAVFQAPLATLADSYRSGGSVSWHGVAFAMHEFHLADPTAAGPDGKRRIWGASARITYQLLELLGLVPPSPDP